MLSVAVGLNIGLKKGLIIALAQNMGLYQMWVLPGTYLPHLIGKKDLPVLAHLLWRIIESAYLKVPFTAGSVNADSGSFSTRARPTAACSRTDNL